MSTILTGTPSLAKQTCVGDPWIQITFALDPKHYRKLWERAETEHRTIPSLVRESVMDTLDVIGTPTRKK